MALVLALILAAVFCALVLARRREKRFPGPAGWPLLGNTLQVPSEGGMWRWFTALYPIYGPIISLRVMGDPILVLNTPADAEEILNKRAGNYARRPESLFMAYRSGGKRMLLLQPGDELTKQRRAMKLMFRPEAIRSYHTRQEEQALGLLSDLLAPQKGAYTLALKRYACGIVMGISFGQSVADYDSDLKEILESNRTLNADAIPLSHLADTFPILDRLPDMLAPWRRDAKAKHQHEAALFGGLANKIKSRMGDESGAQPHCFVSDLWSQQHSLGLDDLSVAYLGGSAFEAGTQTTACMLHCFLLCAMNNPAVIPRAQAELDAVLEAGVPPAFSDFERLPYLFALVKETVRWAPVTPLAFPHVAEKEDEYKGYKIASGTLVMPSIWNMHHHSGVFDNGDSFDPLRFYRPTEDGRLAPDASLVDGHWTFGFGRRACPARYLAVNSVWIAVANMLWAFDVRPAVDPTTGKPADVRPDSLAWAIGVNIEPRSIPMVFTPRSAAHAQVIQAEWGKTLARY